VERLLTLTTAISLTRPAIALCRHTAKALQTTNQMKRDFSLYLKMAPSKRSQKKLLTSPHYLWSKPAFLRNQLGKHDQSCL
jgi:hypothetical protein